MGRPKKVDNPYEEEYNYKYGKKGALTEIRGSSAVYGELYMNITSVGYFREMPDGSPSDPPIKDHIDKGNASIIDKVCAYLDSGLPLIVSPGTALDIIDETKGSAGSLSILTDGKWAWSGLLSYYVKNYNLRLNDDFLETMVSNGWQVPISESKLDYSNINLDGEPL